MKQTILIYTIFRNSEQVIQNYYKQLKLLVNSFPEFDFIVSLYENDSTDLTKSMLQNLDFSFAKEFSLVTENIGTIEFKKSVAEEERVKNIANARNKAIFAKDFLSKADYVFMIESDIEYDIDCVSKLLNFEKNYKLKNVDIVSAALIQKGKHYDSWATRRNSTEEWGNLFDNWRETDYDKYYSTCNGLCLFNAEPFKKGAKYHWYNDRLKKYDCDTSVVCEKFHELGHSNIYINHNAICQHTKQKKVK